MIGPGRIAAAVAVAILALFPARGYA